jgi:hypothetical protein
MTDNFFLNIKVLVAKVLKKKGTSDMIPMTADKFGIADVALISKINCASNGKL